MHCYLRKRIARRNYPKFVYQVIFMIFCTRLFFLSYQNLLILTELWQKIRRANVMRYYYLCCIAFNGDKYFFFFLDWISASEWVSDKISKLCKCTWITIQIYSTRFSKRCQNCIKKCVLFVDTECGCWKSLASCTWTQPRPLPSEAFPFFCHHFKSEYLVHGNAE